MNTRSIKGNVNRAGNVLALRTIGVSVWGFPIAGIALLITSHTSHTLYDFVVGLLLAVLGSIGATLATIAVINAIGDERQAERHEHPSYGDDPIVRVRYYK